MRSLSLSGVSLQGSCLIAWIGFAVCHLQHDYFLPVAWRLEVHTPPETRAHQGFTRQRRDTLGLALNTLAHGTQCSLALVWLLLQAKPLILESCQRWLRDLLPECTCQYHIQHHIGMF